MSSVISAGRPGIVVARALGPQGATGATGPAGPPGQGIDPNASGTLAERAAHDAAADGFVYLQTDSTPWQWWVKGSNTSGDWVGPQPVTGVPIGTDGYHLEGIGPGGPATFKGFQQAGTGSIARGWQTKARETVSVTDFGALGNDSLDNLSAFTSAFNSGARYVTIPFGIYRCSPGLVIPDFVMVNGGGPACSILKCISAVGDFISLGNASRLTNVSIGHQVTRTAGASVAMTGNDAELSDFSMSGWFTGVRMQGPVGAQITAARITDGLMSAPSVASGGSAILIDRYGSPFISNILATGANGGPQPSVGVFVGSGDTAFFTGCHFVGFAANLLSNPDAGTSSFAAQFSNCMFDGSESSACIQLTPNNDNAHIKFWSFNNCWAGTSTNKGLWMEAFGAGATIDGVQWIGGRIINHGTDGIMVGNGAKHIQIEGSAIGKCTNRAVCIAGNAQNVTITDNDIGNIGAMGISGIGISLEIACDYVSVRGNNLSQNTTKIQNVSSGTHNVIEGNIGYNPVGAVSITPTASPMNIQAGPSPMTVYAQSAGGSVTLTQNAVTLGGGTANVCTAHLGPNELLTIFYTGTLTVSKMTH